MLHMAGETAVIPLGQFPEDMVPDSPFQLRDSPVMGNRPHRSRVLLPDVQIPPLHSGGEGDSLLPGIPAGLRRVVQQVAEDNHHIRVPDAALRRDSDLELYVKALGLQILRPGIQEGVHHRIFAAAQVGLVAADLGHLRKVVLGLRILPLLQQQVHGVQMIGDVVTDPADVLILGRNGRVVLLLVVDLLGQQVVFRLQLHPLSHTANRREQGGVRRHAGNQPRQQNPHAVGAEIQPAQHHPAIQQQALADGKQQVQSPLPSGQAIFIAVHQQGEHPQEKRRRRQEDGIGRQLHRNGLKGQPLAQLLRRQQNGRRH